MKARHPEMPVIVMTAYSDLESAVAAFHGGAYEYLPKPFDVDQATDLIRRALEESRREAAVLEPLAEAYCTDQPVRSTAAPLRLCSSTKSERQ